MTFQRALELMVIERECVRRQQCNRNCAKCDLVQDQTELEKAYTVVIDTMKHVGSTHNCEWLFRKLKV